MLTGNCLICNKWARVPPLFLLSKNIRTGTTASAVFMKANNPKNITLANHNPQPPKFSPLNWFCGDAKPFSPRHGFNKFKRTLTTRTSSRTPKTQKKKRRPVLPPISLTPSAFHIFERMLKAKPEALGLFV